MYTHQAKMITLRDPLRGGILSARTMTSTVGDRTAESLPLP